MTTEYLNSNSNNKKILGHPVLGKKINYFSHTQSPKYDDLCKKLVSH